MAAEISHCVPRCNKEESGSEVSDVDKSCFNFPPSSCDEVGVGGLSVPDLSSPSSVHVSPVWSDQLKVTREREGVRCEGAHCVVE